jgi:tight adherence protein C
MLSLLLLVAAPSLAVAAYLVADAITVSGRERHASLLRARRYGQRPSSRPRTGTWHSRVVPRLARLAVRVNSSTDLSAISRELYAAGLGQRLSAEGFLAARVAATAVGAGLGALVGLPGGVVRGVAIALALGAIGYVAPPLALRALVRRRRRLIGPALPDALDLLSVCVQAGLGLDAAIQRLTEHMTGPLVDELQLALSEMRVGESRPNALRRMADRVGVPELTTVVRTILQAEQQGSSLGRALVVQAAESRAKREIVAEAEANKAPVKMLFPTMIFIFPALFVVILGPALLTIARSL